MTLLLLGFSASDLLIVLTGNTMCCNYIAFWSNEAAVEKLVYAPVLCGISIVCGLLMQMAAMKRGHCSLIQMSRTKTFTTAVLDCIQWEYLSVWLLAHENIKTAYSSIAMTSKLPPSSCLNAVQFLYSSIKIYRSSSLLCFSTKSMIHYQWHIWP